MKRYLRILAMALLPLAFAACGDDEAINDGNVTVGFENPSINIRENVTSLNVPIVVSGDHAGLIRVNVSATDAAGELVVIDESVILTSGELNLPAGVNSVNAELRLSVNTTEDLNGRSFMLRITSAEGATIGTAECKVNIDEATDAYDKLLGSWTVVTPEGNFPATLSEEVTGASYRFDLDYSGLPLSGRILYSPTAGLQLECEEIVLSNVNFGDFIGDIAFYPFDGEYYYTGGNLAGIWNDTFDTITFEMGVLGGALYNGEFMGSAFAWPTFNMTKN